MTSSSCILLFVIFCFFSSFVCGKDSFLVLKGTDNYAQSTIAHTEVADLISHVVGLAPVHEFADRTSFPQIDLFNLPRVNLLVAVDAVSYDIMSKIENPKFFTTTGAIEITRDAYPEDSLSLLMSIMTGESWEGHGILGKSWKATDYLGVNAFSENGQCKVPNLADHISFASQGRDRTFIVSGSEFMASAMGVHSELQENHPEWNNQVYQYVSKAGITNKNTQELVASIPTIRSAAQKKMFKIETKEGFILAAELYAIENLVDTLKNHPASDSLDFIGIGLASIKVLSIKFGANSEQVKVALRLLDDALATLSEQLNNMYDNKVIGQVIGLGGSVEEHTSRTHEQQLKKALDEYQYDGYYFNVYGYEEVSAFQTQFWVAVWLIIIVIVAILYLVKMDMLYDSILYKTTDGPRPIPDVK